MAAVRISLIVTAPAEITVDALAVPVATGQRLIGSALDLDRALGGLLSELLFNSEFKGRIHEVMPVPSNGRIAARRVILYGVGSAHDLDGQRMRSAHHELVRAARTYGYKRLALLRTEPLAVDSLQGVVEGCVMGAFERRSRQTGAQPERGEIDELILTGFGQSREHEVVAAQEAGEATNHAREWQNAPPNELTPEALAQGAAKIAQGHGLELGVLGAAELRTGGYNLLLGVASGSAKPARLIRLRHRGKAPAGDAARADATVLALAGKGITFDTGGISLKEPKAKCQMKADWEGAAAVLVAIDVNG